MLAAQLNILVAAGHITPGTKLRLQCAFTSAEGGSQHFTGASAATAKSNGVITFPYFLLEDLNGGHVNGRGTYDFKLVPDTELSVSAPPATDTNGDPLVATVTVD